MKRPTLRNTVPALVVSIGLLVYPGMGQQSRSGGPRYTQSGALVLPANYRDWTFITSGLGMTYGPAGTADAAGNLNFDNVFVNSDSYKAFLKTGAWPDKTVLLTEVRRSDSKVSINKGGHIQTEVAMVEVHVKDATRGGWGFYLFAPGITEAQVLPKTRNCYSCHEQNGAVDTTFVQFYPTLVEAARRRGTFKSGDR